MYSQKFLGFRRSIPCLTYRLSSSSSSHSFPNKDLLFTVKSPNDHIRSALYPLNAADYPKQVLPDLHLIKIFRDIELLKENCEQRNLMVDINQLTSDYQRWIKEKQEYRRLRDLHHIQEKLREKTNEIEDLSMTDIQETELNKTKKRKKKKSKSNESISEPVKEPQTMQHASEMITSVDNAWIDSVAHPLKISDDSPYTRGEAMMNENEFNSLKNHYEQFRERFRVFDQRFLVACLRLPAAQHIAVPAKPSPGITIYESSVPIVKHAFNSKSWHELCHVEKKNDISIFGSYWLGLAPLQKHEFVRFICTELTRLGFQEMSSVSMTKPFLYEALGANINESRHVLTTFESADDPRSRSLITSGLGSLASMLVPFVRRTILQADLPYYVFTQGATYDVKQEQTYKIQILAMTNIQDMHLKNFADPLLEESTNDLTPTLNMSIEREHEYNLQLKTCLTNKKPYRFKETSSLDEIYLELTRLMYNLYEKMGVPFRIQNCPSNKLRSYESMRLDYELFLPSSNSYVRVGSISLIGDYLSRRLMIRHKKSKEDKKNQSLQKQDPDDLRRETKYNYVQMIHVQIVDVDLLTKCFVEKEQKGFSQKLASKIGSK